MFLIDVWLYNDHNIGVYDYVYVYVLLSPLVVNASVWNWSILITISVLWLILFKWRYLFFVVQKLKTRVIKKDVNPEWNEDLTLSIIDPNHQVKLVSGWICSFLFLVCKIRFSWKMAMQIFLVLSWVGGMCC